MRFTIIYIGWPVYCVLPVRDFGYLFSEIDKDELISSLGEVVLKEYDTSVVMK